MSIVHPSADSGAEADTFRESIIGYNTCITSDVCVDGVTKIEYIVGEGDPPFVKYRLTLEPITLVLPGEYADLKNKMKQTEEDIVE